MKRSAPGCVLLMCEDPVCLELIASELRALGCRVLCAHDLADVARLVRAGLTTRFVLVRIGEGAVPATALRAQLAARLPGWQIECDEPDEQRTWNVAPPDSLFN